MQVGLIPPKGLENFALGSNFHLALASPKLMARKTYGGMYTRAGRLGDYVILDNGAAENDLVSDYDLLAAAGMIHASEVVAPDVIRSSAGTIKRTTNFVRVGQPRYKLMGVPQGINLPEFRKCVKAFADLEEIRVIGIPRHMIATIKHKAIRIDFANWVVETYPGRFEIHLLGTDPTWLAEVKHASKYAPHIRSVDSSLPFNYAIAGHRLDTTDAIVWRPDLYFDRDWNGKVDPKLVRQNVETLLEWAGAPDLTRPKANIA